MEKWAGGYNPRYDRLIGEEEARGARVSGTGSVSPLNMDEDALKRAQKRKRQPFGFALPPQRRRKD